MPAPAAFKASFADFRLIKGRKVAQVIVEVPLEEADNALAALGGLPRPDVDRWVAVARLNGSPSPASIPEPARISGAAGEAEAAPRIATQSASAGGGEQKQKRERTLAQRAGILCGSKLFWAWINAKPATTFIVTDANDAAEWLRAHTGVDSRREYDTDDEAGSRFLSLETQYLAETGQMAEERR